jgi:hypothetical protein
MTTYETLTVIISLIGILVGGVAAFVKLKTDIAKIEAKLQEMEREHLALRGVIDKKADYQLVLSYQDEIRAVLVQMNAQINIIHNKLMK